MTAVLSLLLQALTPWTPKPWCPNGCEYRTRDTNEMARHIEFDHAGDWEARR